MWSQRVVGHDRASDQIGSLRFDARIDVLAIVAVRPSIEPAVAYGRHVIRYEIAAELITLVDGDPESAAVRLPRQTDWIA